MTETEKKTEGEAPASSDTQGKKMRWYTLHVYSTMKKSVQTAIIERIERTNLNAACIRATCSSRW